MPGQPVENDVIKYNNGGQISLDPPVAVLEGCVVVFFL